MSELTPKNNKVKWIITITVIVASLMELIDISIVNVALRTIGGNLGATIEEVAWVVTAYAIANIIIIPLTGFLSARFGRKNYFVTSIVIFTIASFFCGNATNIWELVAFRFLQGLGGGALLSTSQTFLVDTFSKDELGKANGLFGLGIVMGPTLGPTIGGYITDTFSWQWIFYVNIPIGIIASLLSWKYIKEASYKQEIRKVDWAGIILLIASIGSIQYVLEDGASKDWFESKLIVGFATLGITSLLLFIWWELRTPFPAVNLRLFKRRTVALGSLLTLVQGIGIFVPVFLFPLFTQNLLGWTAQQTGLMMLPGAFCGGALIGMSGKMLSKGVSPKLLLTLGFIASFTFCYLVSQSNLETNYNHFHIILLIRGMGIGLMFIPIVTMALSGLEPKDVPQAAGLTNMMRQLGGTIGIALMTVFITNRSAEHRIDLVSHITMYDDATKERVAAISNGLVAQGKNPNDVTAMAYGSLNGTIIKQTTMLSYMEGFFVMGLFFLAGIGIVFLVKSSKGAKVDASAAH